MKIATLATKVQKNDSGKIQGIANSLTMTRSGITVTQDAGKEVVGKTVPLLLSHDWNKPSIGSVTMTAVDDDGLHYEGSLFQNAPDRELLLEGIEAGTNYVSIGFGVDNIDADGNIDSIDLLELSLTSTPADPKATAEIVKQAIEKEEDDNMDEEPKAQPADDKEAPTLQDVLDAIADLKKDFDDAKPKDDKPEDDKAPVDDKDAEVQSLKDKVAMLESFLPAVDRRSLSLEEEMAFDRLHY
ncbi:prohead protease [Leuconostoc phage Ln-8]|uniref:Prohead protease n=2 Tax=Unaquatrovirus TaxID=2169622 RepID=A0A0D3MK28_9CAUD|nr:head maturation protease [Leuconostoc phage Ln-8]YP_010080387.1 head maturation protease [Leuconostoc phage Ln-7]AIM50913.1 prohead protease [Leuconostoc phage Ln-8]AOT27884.1 prohead protease [Leuconostoc phage Ln-7]